MFYVYILNSIVNPDRMCIGFTHNVENRLIEHNAGEYFYTKAYMPWKIMTYACFDDKEKAVNFERYLKCSSSNLIWHNH